MQLVPAEKSPLIITDGIGFRISVAARVSSLRLMVDISPNSHFNVVVLLSFRDEHGRKVSDTPSSLGISTKFKLPFFYLKYSKPAARTIEVPAGTAELDIHFVNWAQEPFEILSAAVSSNLSPDEPTASSTLGAGELVKHREIDFGKSPFSRIYANGEYEHMLRLEPGSSYCHKLTIAALQTDSANSRYAVILPRFYDNELNLLASQGNKFSTSSKLGDYVYLPSSGEAETTSVEFAFPDDARWYGYRIAHWTGKRDLVIAKDALEQVGMSRTRQVKKIGAELIKLQGIPANKIYLIYTGTTLIGKDNRANRSMMFASELVARGNTVVYVYYRSSLTHSILEDQLRPETGSGKLVQIPNDLFADFSDRIVQLGRKGGRALLSIPDAGAIPLLNHLRANGWRTGYEARDDWEEFQAAGAARWYSVNFERYLARRSDFSLSVSPPLQSKLISMGARAQHSSILPNGAGASFHKRFQDFGTVSKSRGGKIGYFGHLTTKWFDWPAFVSLARNEPQLEFEIIGHGTHPEIDLPNVKFLGPMNHEQIIEVAKDWEIGLIPFTPSRLANAVDPIKIYEYFCLGLKVVSVFMEQISSYPNVYVYNQSSDLATAISKARAADFDHAQNIEFCRNCSWADRVAGLEAIFDEAVI
ncbi:Glycosyltransferase involved in cell wall bisynthesis [Paracoccus isoporae]|uniref:Glycosyltransferase involved in cell wall bisynthesis n=1 Tax=Paracoccus isoporae TaxID=591205 RepID=A0A1G7HGJ6_9RHOB|nr:glycosyltransferase family 4 protein [Paracoccus isoporae]SDE99592.1 Glycosyltransferase involved in cell wall bisynthesis [Paracoccus isoporae]